MEMPASANSGGVKPAAYEDIIAVAVNIPHDLIEKALARHTDLALAADTNCSERHGCGQGSASPTRHL